MKGRSILKTLLIAGCLLHPLAAIPQDQSLFEERIEVRGESWHLGDRKTYTFIFEQLPLGRLVIELKDRSRRDGRDTLVFHQSFWLEAQGLGQKGRRSYVSTIRYTGSTANDFHLDEIIRSWDGYRDGLPHKVREKRRRRDENFDAILLDIEMVGHLERLLLNDTLKVGDRRTYSALVTPREYDYEKDNREFSPEPEEKTIEFQVNRKEPIALFGYLEIDAFRCTIPELGYTLWVSEGGALLKFDNGNHMIAFLEE